VVPIPAGVKIIIFLKTARPALGPKFYARKLGRGKTFGLKRLGNEADRSAPLIVKFKNE
jgi:hypothetical protein